MKYPLSTNRPEEPDEASQIETPDDFGGEVEKKIRRHLARACQRRGFGWKRWSREWLYGTLGLFAEYRVSYEQSSSAVAPD